MMFVFYMDKGRMLTFDVELAYQPISALQKEISQQVYCKPGDLVLLINGGECLDPRKRICDYTSSGAGTDTNPIFLITHADVTASSMLDTEQFSSNSKEEIHNCISEATRMKPSFDSICEMTQVAKAVARYGAEHLQLSEDLVHEQHLLQQGWFVVVANLEDSLDTFVQRFNRFKERYRKYLDLKERYSEVISHVSDDLAVLKAIKLPAALRVQCSHLDTATSSSSISSASPIKTAINRSSTINSTSNAETLFDWIAAADPDHDLQEIAIETTKSLKRLDTDVLTKIEAQFSEAIKTATNNRMKEIIGLRERISKLNEYLQTYVKENQNQIVDLCQSIEKLENRALSSNDKSILPDLHQYQVNTLRAMNTLYTTMWDYVKRFYHSKMELLKNIRQRFDWVSEIQTTITAVDDHVMICTEQLRRVKLQLDLLKQVHEAPQVYAASMSEVVRRKCFSQKYLEWSSKLSCQVAGLHSEESTLREELTKKLNTHFLKLMFPGMQDQVPDYALRAPLHFDQDLAQVHESDISQLKFEVPKLSTWLKLYPCDVERKLTVLNPKVNLLSMHTSTSNKGPVISGPGASIYAQSPPRLNLLTKSMPSTAFLSGDDSFSDSGTSPLMHGLQPLVRPKSQLDDTSTVNTDVASGSGSAAITIVRSNSTRSGSSHTTGKSAPIRIPSRSGCGDGNGALSRQYSEMSSQAFGTPEEGIDVEDGDTSITVNSTSPRLPPLDQAYPIAFMQNASGSPVSSPPEIITRSQCEFYVMQQKQQQSMDAINAVKTLHAKSMIESPERRRPDSSIQSSNHSSVLPLQHIAGRSGDSDAITVEECDNVVMGNSSPLISGMLLDAMSSKESSREGLIQCEYDQLLIKLEAKDDEIVRLRTALSDANIEAESKLKNSAGQIHTFKSEIQADLSRLKADVTDFMQIANDNLQSELSVETIQLLVSSLCSKATAELQTELDAKYQLEIACTSVVENENVEKLKSQLTVKISDLEMQLELQSHKYSDLENEIETYESLVRSKSDLVEHLQEELTGRDEKFEKEFQEQRQLFDQSLQQMRKEFDLEHEIELDKCCANYKYQLNEKEVEIDNLTDQIKEYQVTAKQLLIKQDQLTLSICEKDASLNKSSLTSIMDEYELKLRKQTEEFEIRLKKEIDQTKMEVHKQCQATSNLLLSGIEEKHNAVLTRMAQEKDFELRKLGERHESDIDRLKEENDNLLNELTSLKQDHDELIDLKTVEGSNQKVENLSSPVIDDISQCSPLVDEAVQTIENAVAEATEEAEAHCKSPSKEVSTKTTQKDFTAFCLSCSNIQAAEDQALQFPPGSYNPCGRALIQVAIFDICVGDLAFFVYNPECKHYEAFSLLKTHHFLSQNSHQVFNLPALSSGTSSNSSNQSEVYSALSQTKSRWLLGRVTKTDHCIAKKDKNRFNIPKQTKFHLLEAIPYTKEMLPPTFPFTGNKTKVRSELVNELED